MATVARETELEFAAGSPGAVSWPAILAGAIAAASLSLILLVLGTGLGLSVVSPWADSGASVEALSWSAIGWIVFTALFASGLGGYLAGRLRVKWVAAHTDEVYFRDTAHGFLAWGVATLLTAAALTSAVGAILGVGASGAAAVAATSAGAQSIGQDTGPAPGMNGSGQFNQQPAYTLDALFRRPAIAPATEVATVSGAEVAGDMALTREAKNEIAGIFANSITAGPLSEEDASYAAQLVSQRTGLSTLDAQRRVNDLYDAAYRKAQEASTQAKELADEARRNAAYASLWIFVSLLGGAFFASLMATFGGRQRDRY